MSDSPAPGTPVSIREETMVIPTYPAPAPEPNPMFFEKRVNQGASGRVYPNPVTDRLSDERVDRPYQMVILENEYVQVMVLPEIGGRIFAGLDKTNGYDFFYRQHVIKPALIGLFGSWMSGGVEFNWPMHHRPGTFLPTDYVIEEGADGSRTVWLSEHDPHGAHQGHGRHLPLSRQGHRRDQSAPLQSHLPADVLPVVGERRRLRRRRVSDRLPARRQQRHLSHPPVHGRISHRPRRLLRPRFRRGHRHQLVSQHPAGHVLLRQPLRL